MEGLDQITGELFVSVDEAGQALDEVTLPEGYVTTTKRQHRVSNSKDSKAIAVNLQYSCSAIHNRRFIEKVIL